MIKRKKIGIALQILALTSVGGCFYFANNSPITWHSEGYILGKDLYAKTRDFGTKHKQSIKEYFRDEINRHTKEIAVSEYAGKNSVSTLWFEGAKYCFWHISDDFKAVECFFQRDGDIYVKRRAIGSQLPGPGRAGEVLTEKHSQLFNQYGEPAKINGIDDIQAYINQRILDDLKSYLWLTFILLSLVSPALFLVGARLSKNRNLKDEET